MAKCLKRKCPLYGQREVPYSGSTESKIVAVGESPGHQEVLEGVPFYAFAPAGELARDACSKVGLDWDSLFLTNSARCLIDKNRMSNKAITQTLAFCRPKLCFALQALAPEALVLFGGYALRQILRHGGITKARGIWVWSDEFNCWCMPTFHPAYICRNPGLMKLLVNDLSKVADFVNNNYEIQTEEEGVDYREVDSPFPYVKPGQTIGIDTEDTGLDWLSPNFVTVSYSVSWEDGKAVHIVLYEEVEENDADFSITVNRIAEGEKKQKPTTVWVKRKSDFKKRLADLRSVLEDQTIKKYMMNGPFDVHAFNALCRRENVQPMKITGWAMDIQASAHVLDENVFKMASLRDLQGAFTDCKSALKGELKNDGILIEDILGSDPVKLKDYASFDADMTRRVGVSEKDELLTPKNRRLANYVAKFVTPVLQHVIVPMEEHGIFIDAKAMPSVRNETKTELDTLSETAIQCIKKKVRGRHAEKGLRLTRGDLIRDALFSEDGFGLEPIKKTKGKEAWAVDKEVRTRLLDRKRLPKKAKEFLEAYKQWADLDMLRKKLGEIEKFLTPDSRIHTHLSMVIAVTGRISSSKPNLLNIPKRSSLSKKIRRLIAAPPGKLLLAADAEQNELRWFADIANETEMLKVFAAGEDIHRATAMSLVSKSIDQWTKEELALYRRNSKCFHPDTEVLTKHGWVRITDLEGEEIIQAWPRDGWIELEWTQNYERRAEKNHFDSLVHLRNEGIDLRVTPDHRMLVQRANGKFEVTDPKGFTSARYWWNAGALITGDEEAQEGLLRVAVAAQADGSFEPPGSIHFAFSKERKIRRMRHLLDGFKHSEHRWKSGVVSFRLLQESAAGVRNLLDDDKTMPWRWLGLPPELRNVILEEAKFWDSHKGRKWRAYRFSSINKKNIDVLQAIAATTEHKTRSSCDMKVRQPQHNPVWSLSVKENCRSRGENVESGNIEHIGDVAVLSVPSSFVLVRDGGVPVITGQSVNFGLIFGMMAKGFVRYAKVEYNIDLTEEEALRWKQIFFRRYPGIPRYHKQAVQDCKLRGYVESPLGRRRRLPDIYSENKYTAWEAARQAINHPTQSIGSDAVLLADKEIRVKDYFNPDECRDVLFIHDELIFEVADNSKVEDHAKIIKFEMENPPIERDFGYKPKVMPVTGIKVGKNLAEMEELRL